MLDAGKIAQLEAAIAALEAQRALLGDAVVELALAPLRQQLAEARVPAAPAPPARPMEGEFKLVTVMFADVSGFTTLAEQLDPEQVRNLMNACFDCMAPVIEKYEGTVDKFLGDAVVALFGAPVTHENDPERALRAALEMKEALAAFNAERGTELGIHFGINTGEVVAGGIGSAGRQEYSVMGDAVNVASRLKDLSQRGEVFVGGDTHRLTAPLFEFETLPPLQVKGRTRPVTLHRLIRARATPGPVRGVEGLRSPLVGRDDELSRLLKVFEALAEGRGGFLALLAEAGQGKSRLVAEARRLFPAGARWVEGRALSYAQNISYWVAADLLRGLVGVSLEASPSEIGVALSQSCERLFGEQAMETHPYLARLLDVHLDEPMAERVRYLAPDALQRRMQQAFVDILRASAREQPLVLVAEDTHWIDPSSLALLEAIVPLTAEVPLLLLIVSRPEEGPTREFLERVRASLGESSPFLELAPLSREASTELLDNLLRIENLPDATRQMILNKAEGNAFFLEELLRSLIDAGALVVEGGLAVATRPIEAIDVPDTLQGVIAARIDRLAASEKHALQTASVIGRIFQRRLLAYLLRDEVAESQLDPSLHELRRRELIRIREAIGDDPSDSPVDAEYIFKHAVTQDVTYHSLLHARRKSLHRAAAEAIETLFPEHLDDLSATLAYHYDKAELVPKAVQYLSHAAERARATYANAEAIAYYRAALRQIAGAADPREWSDAAVTLCGSLGDVLDLIGKPEEARSAYMEGLGYLPDGPSLRRAGLHRGLGTSWARRHRFQEALEEYQRAETALDGPPAEEDEAGWREWAQIQIARLSVYYYANRVADASALLAQTRPVVERYSTPAQRARFFNRLHGIGLRRERLVPSEETLGYALESLAAARASQDAGEIVLATFNLAFCRFWRGELDLVEQGIHQALALAERIGDLWVQTVCLTYLCFTRRRQGDVEGVRCLIPRCQDAASAGDLSTYIAYARANEAWLVGRDGDLPASEALARSAKLLWDQQTFWTHIAHWAVGWILIGAALAREEIAEAMEQARLVATQSEPPPQGLLAARISAALQAWNSGDVHAARTALGEAVVQARAEGLL
jgi:class 3 adenylate cyclase